MNTPNELAEARAQRLPELERGIFEGFKRLGMGPAAALAATQGRDGSLPSTDPDESLVERFERHFTDVGCAPDAARRMAEAAVTGRNGESLRGISESLRESALATRGSSTLVTLRETGARLGEAAAGGTRRQITIIEAGWGSSGYYSRELLERDGPRVFAAGLQMFLDHPTRTEESDRPERSVRDLAGRVATAPRMAGNALVAEAEVFEVWRPVIDSLANEIGLSIRATGETEMGEAEGRRGPIVTSLTEGISIDFVTKAGAGGKVGQLIESARTTAPVRDADTLARIAERRARLVTQTTDRYEREGLAPTAAKAKAESLWVSDEHVLEAMA